MGLLRRKLKFHPASLVLFLSLTAILFMMIKMRLNSGQLEHNPVVVAKSQKLEYLPNRSKNNNCQNCDNPNHYADKCPRPLRLKLRDRMDSRRQFNRYDKSSSSHEKRKIQPGTRGKESEQYKRLRVRDEDNNYYSSVTETSLAKYVPLNAPTRPAQFDPATPTSRTNGGRRVERDQSGANQIYEMCGSTVEGKQLLSNIDSGANRIIIQRVHLFDQLNWGERVH